MKCPECGACFTPTHPRQRFCTTAHKQHFHDVMAQRGKVSTPFLLTWRTARHGDKARKNLGAYAFGELAKLADAWSAVDKAAGRDPSLIVTAKGDASWTAVDLPGARK